MTKRKTKRNQCFTKIGWQEKVNKLWNKASLKQRWHRLNENISSYIIAKRIEYKWNKYDLKLIHMYLGHSL